MMNPFLYDHDFLICMQINVFIIYNSILPHQYSAWFLDGRTLRLISTMAVMCKYAQYMQSSLCKICAFIGSYYAIYVAI